MNAANLALRFLLELAALSGFGILAWSKFDGWWRYLAVIIIVAVVMTIWGVFAVPDDPSRSGNAPIPVPGILRLVLEIAILVGGAYAFHGSGHSYVALILAALIALHYALSGERIAWLLQQ